MGYEIPSAQLPDRPTDLLYNIFLSYNLLYNISHPYREPRERSDASVLILFFNLLMN